MADIFGTQGIEDIFGQQGGDAGFSGQPEGEFGSDFDFDAFFADLGAGSALGPGFMAPDGGFM